jgi:hypothetical protein
MLNREFCVALLAEHNDEAEGGPLDQAHDAVVAQLGWRAFSDEALSLMATELLRLSGMTAMTDPAGSILTTAQRRH